MRTPISWDEYFIELTELNRKRSKDPCTQVGAVVVSPDNANYFSGYNGFPVGYPETPEMWERGEKEDHVLHAEVNAVLNAMKCGVAIKGWRMYCTYPPCANCAKFIVQSGITALAYVHSYGGTNPDTEDSIRRGAWVLELGKVMVWGPADIWHKSMKVAWNYE